MELKLQGKNGVSFLHCAGFPVPHGFSTRLGGVSQGIYESMNLGTTRGDDPRCVRENYRRFCAAVGTKEDRIVMSNQVHSAVVRTVTADDVKDDLYDPEGYEVDGLVTNVPGLCLVVFSADCIPLLFCDPVAKVVAAVHAGWRGTAARIGAEAVRKMAEEFGSRRGDILAAIGPGIGPCCFETHSDVPDAMAAALGGGVKSYVTPGPGEKFHVDLKGINRQILLDAGVLPEHIAVSDHCTSCLPELYWSHRVTCGHRGSQVAMIAL